MRPALGFIIPIKMASGQSWQSGGQQHRNLQKYQIPWPKIGRYMWPLPTEVY